MPSRQRPAASGYARLAQADEEDSRLSNELDEDAYLSSSPLSRYTSIQPGPRDGMRSNGGHTPTKKRGHDRRRIRSNSSGVDIKAINARLERWAEEIASKFKISSNKGKTDEEEHLEIHHSVFQAPEGVRPITAEALREYTDKNAGGRMTKTQFEDVVESVRVAIEIGVHPKMITQGSSGSYFARNSDGKVVGVFKPKDEEPYASRNPKWTKWIHRNLFPFFFGRACLIPNLSYVSEAAAYVLDTQLRTNIVPYTDVIYLSSRAFFYDFWERRSYWRGKKSLPQKPGSFQVFLKGFKDANIFLRENPWPDQNVTEYPADMQSKRRRRNLSSCIPGGAISDDEDDETEPRQQSPPPSSQPGAPKFQWTPSLKQAFREELEKLVILDYIMRNTDRGLDNWMIRIDYKTEEVNIVAEPPKPNGNSELAAPTARTASVSPQRPTSNTSRPYRRYEVMAAESRAGTPLNIKDENGPSISLGAIDNSLSWPWKHPDAWRSFPFGWLFLPVSLIGQPFSQKTRDHFLPLLTSTAWWSETQLALRRIFAQDDDFKESMFARQIAVMKGQAWNVVETLKQPDHGPLELTRRTRVCVWDDLVDIPVAMPLRTPSTEIHRSRKARKNTVDEEEEEMDIGAALGSGRNIRHAGGNATAGGTQADLLIGSPTTTAAGGDLGFVPEESSPASPATIGGLESSSHDYLDAHAREATANLSHSVTLPPRPKSKSRFSFEFSRRNYDAMGPSTSGRKRQRSMSTRSVFGTKNASSASLTANALYDGDDLEGDLGYAAASDMEGQMKKVIVERVEVVKSKNPVFTWC